MRNDSLSTLSVSMCVERLDQYPLVRCGLSHFIPRHNLPSRQIYPHPSQSPTYPPCPVPPARPIQQCTARPRAILRWFL